MMGSYRRTLAAAIATILASVSLYPIFIDIGWFFAGAGAVAAVAAAGTLTRLRRLPVAVCLAGGLAGLLLYLNAVFESGRSWLALIPTPNSLGDLWDLAGQGFNEAARYAPPVPELSGMVLLAAAGIGLTALLTDLIAVRLQSAALAGLPLLLLFTEPFTLSVSRSALGTSIAFGLGTAGYLAMLSSEGRDRIREWERPNPGPLEAPDTRALTAAGRRVGIASVALALFIPLFVPGLHATRLFGGQAGIGGTGGSGGGGVGFPDPNTQLSTELHESRAATVFSYSSSAPEYFQLYVLDKLTDSGWQMFSQPESLVSASPRLPAAPGLTNTTSVSPVTTTVAISQGVGQDVAAALPLPYPATAVTAPGDLRADQNSLMVFDSGVQLAGLRYSITSLDETPTAQQLNAAPAPPATIAAHYLKVPSSYDSLRQLAETVVGAAKAKTPFEKAVALQNWLSDGTFSYTLNAPTITNARGLTTFLTSTKQGYCQQFSFAMAVLARLLGIPSRVAYGFTSGTSIYDGVWVVTTHDAHAWPELYFQGLGWLRFEPTPQGTTGQGTATTPSYTLQLGNGLSQSSSLTPAAGPSPSASTGDSAAQLRQRLNLPIGGDSLGPTTPGTPAPTSAWEIAGFVVLGLLGLLILAAATPACARRVIRRRRRRSAARRGDAGLAHAAWRELRDDLVDYRVGYLPSESPRALAARVGSGLELPEPAMAALRRIAMAEERARYAARPGPGTGLRQDSTVVRRAIDAAVPRRARWRARLFPSSVLTPALIRVGQALDPFGRLNPQWPRNGGLGGSRLGGFGLLGRTRRPGASPAAESAASRSEPPVAAGTGRR